MQHRTWFVWNLPSVSDRATREEIASRTVTTIMNPSISTSDLAKSSIVIGTSSGSESSPVSKRPRLPSTTDEQAAKRLKIGTEEPSLYSENVRRKLAATTRTGQACDRCKERKMKCDPDPIACQPCRLKSLKCYTTDRVTGQPRERGQSDRADNELAYLKDQLAQYQSQYGLLTSSLPPDAHTASITPTQEAQFNMHDHRMLLAATAPGVSDLPSSRYIGWSSRESHGPLQKGPVEGTRANILDWGTVDSGAFDCEIMREPLNDDIEFFNFSTSSVLKSIYQRQKIQFSDLQFPMKSEAVELAETFMDVMWAYYPVVHKPAFRNLINRFYDNSQQVSLPERIQVVQMLGILSHQHAIRNQAKVDKIKDSHRYFHFALGHFPELIKDNSLPALQALSLILLQFRNMPRPGYTWNLAQELLHRCIDLEYHRDPENIHLPIEQQNMLAKELRKRVFHAILGICVTTGCRMGRPAPWQFVQWDVPLPMALLDSELSEEGIQTELSGHCDFRAALQLAKLLPLYTELHNYILSVRRSPNDYLMIVEHLKLKIEAWRADWDASTASEDKSNYHLTISDLLIDSWAAEFILNLHHPSVCAANISDVVEKNLTICHKAAKRLLSNFHTLSNQYKAADFTWHTTVAYTLAFGLTLHVHRRRRGPISQDQFDAVKNELAGWMSLVAIADLVLRTNNMLYKQFIQIVDQVTNEVAERVVHYGQMDGSSTKASFGVASTSNRHLPMTKHDTNMISPGPFSPPSSSGAHSGNVHHTSSANFLQNSMSGHVFSQASPTAPTFALYNPPTAAYPTLPTSLAPLLNEAPPHSVAQFQQPLISVQDPAMMFSPQLYTDPTAVWPVGPETQYHS